MENGQAKKTNNFQVKSKGAILFPIVRIMVLLVFVFEVCMFFKNTTE